MEYNPRERSFSFWGEEESNPEATGHGVPVALIFGDSPTSSVLSPGRPKTGPSGPGRVETVCVSEAHRPSVHFMDLQKALTKFY